MSPARHHRAMAAMKRTCWSALHPDCKPQEFRTLSAATPSPRGPTISESGVRALADPAGRLPIAFLFVKSGSPMIPAYVAAVECVTSAVLPGVLRSRKWDREIPGGAAIGTEWWNQSIVFLPAGCALHAARAVRRQYVRSAEPRRSRQDTVDRHGFPARGRTLSKDAESRMTLVGTMR
jgi:hypothetical protein